MYDDTERYAKSRTICSPNLEIRGLFMNTQGWQGVTGVANTFLHWFKLV